MKGTCERLSIRQPFAELILRGIKTSEFRSRSTRTIGERFYIYASKRKLSVASCQLPVQAWSEDLRAGTPPGWMVELAEQIRMIEPELHHRATSRRCTPGRFHPDEGWNEKEMRLRTLHT